MLIDYFTTIAQIINFLVLVFLLRHFLYRPVIKSMDEREQKIASRLKEADEKRKAAEQEEESIRKIKQDLANKHDDMMAKAIEDAGAARDDLIKKAREEVDRSKADWYDALERQKDAFLTDMRIQAGKEVYAVARRALRDLANEEIEGQMIGIFLERLENIEESDKERIKEFYKKPGQQIVIRSAFEIPEETRQKIQETLRHLIGTDVIVRYETAPDLISGIELVASDMKIAWSIDGYLDGLEADLSRTLEQRVAEEKAS